MSKPADPGPVALLFASVIPVAGAITIDTPRAGVAVVVAEVVAFGWLVRDLRATARRLMFGAVAALSISISTYLYGGHHLDLTVAAAMRIMAIVVPGAILIPRIDPSELGDQLAQRLRLAPRVVVASTVGLQRIDAIGDEWRQIQRARRARGMGLDGNPMRRLKGSAGSAFSLLVLSMRRTSQLATAMDARGFAAATRRTWAVAAPWRVVDPVVAALAVAVVAVGWLLH